MAASSCVEQEPAKTKCGSLGPSQEQSDCCRDDSLLFRLFGFGPDEVVGLRGIFSLYENDAGGYITPKALEILLQKLEMKRAVADRDNHSEKHPHHNADRITFARFLQTLELQASTSSSHNDTHGSSNSSNLTMNLIRIAEECRHASVLSSNYLQAEKAAKQLTQLTKQEEKRRQQLATANKASNMSKIKAAHNQQYLDFAAQWDAHMQEFDVKATEHVSDVKERQSRELQSFQDKLVSDVESRPPKWSHELIHWRKRQHVLADQRNYAEAQQIKTIADAIEDEERENMNEGFAGSFEKKEAALRQQQAVEVKALLKRITVRREELEKQRERDCKRLVQRSHNVVAALESKGALEGTRSLERIKTDLRNEVGAIREAVAASAAY